MKYAYRKDWQPYLKDIPRPNSAGTRQLVSKDAPQKIKAEIRALNESIFKTMERRDFVFEGEDDAG